MNKLFKLIVSIKEATSVAIFCVIVLQITNCFSGNLLPNSSFEVTTIPDIPDFYDHYLGPKKVDQWFSSWTVEQNYAYHGNKSLRIDIQSANEIGKVSMQPVMHQKTMKTMGWESIKKGENYTFSLYMKSNKKNMPVRVDFEGNTYLTVGNKWKRFSVTKKITTDSNTFPYISVTPSDQGQLWIDALQLEKGDSVTQYTPATYDNDLFPINSPLSTTEVFQKLLEEKTSLMSVIPVSIISNLSFYTTEKSAEIKIDISPEHHWPIERKLTIELIDNSTNEIVLSNNIIDNSNSITHLLNLTEIDVGEYTVLVNILTNNDQIIHHASTTLFKREMKQNEVKIDHKKKCLVVNNEQFYLIGAAFMRAHMFMDRVPQLLQSIRDKGYTTVIASFSYRNDLSHGSEEEIKWFFDIANQLGLKVIPWINPNAKEDENGTLKALKGNFNSESILQGYKDEIERMVPIVKDHPALLAWYLCDEPWRAPLVQSKFTDKIINYARKLDKHHPLYVNYGALKKHLSIRNGQIPDDIVSLTQYPIPNDPLTQIAELTGLEKLASKGHKPVTLWLQFWGGYGRYPTPSEFSSMAYLALIYGATGFQTWPMMPSSELLWAHTGSVIKEMKVLLPIFTNGEIFQDFGTTPGLIHYKAVLENNNVVLVAVNSSPTEIIQEFSLGQSNTVDNEVEVLFENRSLLFIGNRFSDKFEGFERHVYTFPIVQNKTPHAPQDLSIKK